MNIPLQIKYTEKSYINYFQSWLSGSHHRTTKSGILVENPITRAGIHDAELVAKDDTENDDDDEDVDDK